MLRAILAVIAPFSARTRPICPEFHLSSALPSPAQLALFARQTAEFLQFLRAAATGRTLFRASIKDATGRLGAPSPTPAAPVLV